MSVSEILGIDTSPGAEDARVRIGFALGVMTMVLVAILAAMGV